MRINEDQRMDLSATKPVSGMLNRLSGEPPRLFGIERPRPKVEATRTIDMSGSNAWAEFADLYLLLLFETFLKVRTAAQVMRAFVGRGLALPRRDRHGDLRWQ